MRFLSSRRRHPAAKALLLVLGLFVMGSLYAVFAPAGQSSADTGTSQQVEEGRALFAVGCSSLGSFSARFTELVGETPTAYRARDHRGMASVPGCIVAAASLHLLVGQQS